MLLTSCKYLKPPAPAKLFYRRFLYSSYCYKSLNKQLVSLRVQKVFKTFNISYLSKKTNRKKYNSNRNKYMNKMGSLSRNFSNLEAKIKKMIK